MEKLPEVSWARCVRGGGQVLGNHQSRVNSASQVNGRTQIWHLPMPASCMGLNEGAVVPASASVSGESWSDSSLSSLNPVVSLLLYMSLVLFELLPLFWEFVSKWVPGQAPHEKCLGLQ